MNPPQVYMCSPSWTPLPPPSPYHPYGFFNAFIMYPIDHFPQDNSAISFIIIVNVHNIHNVTV